MFCPKCATQNVDGASFCRSCGANIGLIPQALTGNLPQAPAPDDFRSMRRRMRGRDVEPSIEKGILNVFMGLGFIVAALAIMIKFPAGVFWGWSFFIPGFSNLGRGIAAIVAAQRAGSANTRLPPANSSAYFSNERGTTAIGPESAAQTTGRLMTPVPSVTEGTTRHLGAEASTRHLDRSSGEEKMP
jgi:hypothetical protein